MSRIGKKPISIPSGVKVNIDGSYVEVEGPKGKLDFTFSNRMKIDLANNQIVVSRHTDSKKDKTFHGTTRSLINNMVEGVVNGFVKELEIQGVGYRAAVEGKTLKLQLGFSHPIEYHIPEGITIKTPKPTQVVVEGIDKAAVGQTAAKIRDYYKPEPYKGKGIRYVGEYVRRKAGKKAG